MSTQSKDLPEGVTLVLTNEGKPLEQKNRWGETKTIQINRVWEVRRGEEVLGTIDYRMVTKERKAKGQRYVLARWSVPGWSYRVRGKENQPWGASYGDARSRRNALLWILSDHGYKVSW
jgi:hypothetical protein